MEYRSKKLVWRNSSCMMTLVKEVYAYGGIPQNSLAILFLSFATLCFSVANLRFNLFQLC